MDSYKYLIIGGGIAGTTAAETLRKQDSEGSIAIVSDEPHPLYSRILLSKPNFFLGKVPFDTIWMRQENWYEEQGIDFLSGKEAVKLDPEAHEVVLSDGRKLSYDKLLLATGCPVRQIPIPGLDKKGVNYVKTVDDAREIITNVESAGRAVVIGSGFISFEMLDMLHLAGLEVEAVIREKYFWEPVLDQAGGRIVENKLKDAGVNIRLETEVQEVLGDDQVCGVKLDNGKEIDCQIVILGVGVKMEADWLERAGLEINRGIVCDQKLKTNLPDVWTAGDAAEYHDVVLDCDNMCGLWINAQMQGKTAAQNMLGENRVYRYLPSYTAHGFGLDIGFVGQVRRGENEDLVVRDYPADDEYAGLVVRNSSRVMGGFTINASKDMTPMIKLVKERIDVSDSLEQLGDIDKELSSLINSDK